MQGERNVFDNVQIIIIVKIKTLGHKKIQIQNHPLY